MNFRTNFNKISLLGNIPIKIYFEDKTVEFVPPNLRLYLTDLDFAEFLYIIKQTPEEYNSIVGNTYFIVKNNYETFLAILKTYDKAKTVIEYFNKLFPNLNYVDSQFKCNEVPLTDEEYNILIDALFVSCAEKEYNEFINQTKKVEVKNSFLTEAENRLKAIKDKAKKVDKKEDTSKANAITIDQIIIAILYEFPSLTLDRIYDMNMFTLLDFWKYISKVVDNQIQIVAAGNGNIKKFTYFIN